MVLAGKLRDQGHEVILLGSVSAQEALATALQEDADVIGVSCYCGGHLEYTEALRGFKGELWIGGVIPQDDIPALMAKGFKINRGG